MRRSLILGMAAAAALTLVGAGGTRASDEPAAGKATALRAGFVDVDGDGVCDNCTAAGRGQRSGQGKAAKPRKGRGGNGPADGSGNQGVRPRDGSGYGPGSGSCDGSGSRSQRPRGGQSQRQGRRGSRS
jgi:hypothetical protein